MCKLMAVRDLPVIRDLPVTMVMVVVSPLIEKTKIIVEQFLVHKADKKIRVFGIDDKFLAAATSQA